MPKAKFKWEDNMVCQSVYLILEDDHGMDELENEIYAFDDAGEVKMEQLVFFILASGASSKMRDHISTVKGIKFIRLLTEKCAPKWRVAGSSYEIVRDQIVNLFKSGDTKLVDIAEYIDSQFILSKLPS